MNSLARILSVAGLALGLALAGVPAGAQQPSPAAIAAAKEIMAMKNASAQYALAVPSIVGRIKQEFLADADSHNHLDYEQDIDEVAVIVANDFAGREQEIGDGWATVYATEFTEQELKDLVTFYKSPLGRKLLVAEPRVTMRNAAYTNEWAQAFSETARAQFRTEMHKRGKDI
jgi:hypothetical protein